MSQLRPCETCDEDFAEEGGVLCSFCAMKELRERLWEMVSSASPNPFNHPTMTWAWERARKTLERTGRAPKP